MHADAERPEVPECVAARDSLLQSIAALDLPSNFLDELVHQLGGPGKPYILISLQPACSPDQNSLNIGKVIGGQHGLCLTNAWSCMVLRPFDLWSVKGFVISNQLQ